MIDPSPNSPQVEPLTRVQILIAMGITAIALLVLARLWLVFDPAVLLPVLWDKEDALLGVGLGVLITLLSAAVYRFWPAYRESANFYLDLILRPLTWLDIIWLGLLPGMSEELLFRGVMLPSLGLNGVGLVVSSVIFGVMHFSGSQKWAYVIWAAAIGAILGSSVLLTGNLLVPIIAHILTNLISSYFWKGSHLAPKPSDS